MWPFSGGTASVPSDVSLVTNTVTFADGDTLPKTVQVPIVHDAIADGGETVILTLSNPIGGPLGAQTSHTLTITDTDAPGVLGNDSDVDSPSLTAVLVANAVHGNVMLQADGRFTYTPTSGYAGPDSFTYKPNDGTVDGNTVTVSLTVGGSALSVNDVVIAEGDRGTSSASFTVTLAPPSSVQVAVTVQSRNGTVSSGSDYTALPPTTLTFAPGETSKTVAVAVAGDLTVETDETFTVALGSPTAATVAKAGGIGTITNDDTPACGQRPNPKV
jgi:large repetitive protein